MRHIEAPEPESAVPLFWNHNECAAALGVSLRTLLNWRKNGTLPASCWWQPPGRDIWYRRAKVTAWAAGELAEPTRGRRA